MGRKPLDGCWFGRPDAPHPVWSGIRSKTRASGDVRRHRLRSLGDNDLRRNVGMERGGRVDVRIAVNATAATSQPVDGVRCRDRDGVDVRWLWCAALVQYLGLLERARRCLVVERHTVDGD